MMRSFVCLCSAWLALAGTAIAGDLSLDKASTDQLASLEYVGPELAKSVVDLRSKRGLV